MNTRQELKVSVPLKRLKPTTIKNITNLKSEVPSDILKPAIDDAHLLLSLSNTVSVAKMEVPPKDTSQLIIDLDSEESETKENKIADDAKLPIPAPEKEENNYVVTKEQYELLNFLKEKGLTRSVLERVTVPEPERSRGKDRNNNSQNNNNNKEGDDILIDLSLDDKKFKLDDDLSEKLISQSKDYKAIFINMLNFYQNKHKPKRPTSISVSNIIREIVDTAKDLENNIILTFDKSTQTTINDDKMSTNNMAVEYKEPVMKTAKMHQMPISPVPGALPNDNQQQKQHHSLNYPSSRMMSALEMPEHVQRMNKSWHTVYGAKGAGTEIQQRHLMQKMAAAASNSVLPGSAFTPQHFPASNNQVPMAAQQKRDSTNVTATMTSNVAMSPACFNTQYAAFNNQDLQAMQNVPVAAMHVAAGGVYGHAAASNFAMHQQPSNEYAPAVMRNMPATATPYLPTAGPTGQLDAVFTPPQQCTGYGVQSHEIRKRVKNTPTRFQQLGLPSPVENQVLSGQQRWRAMVAQRQWQSPASNYPHNSGWPQ